MQEGVDPRLTSVKTKPTVVGKRRRYRVLGELRLDRRRRTTRDNNMMSGKKMFINSLVKRRKRSTR
jgi:hypothetical protein